MLSVRRTLADVLGRLWVLEHLSDPASVAAGLTAEDFGNDVNAKIGLNYMKGEIEVLRDELGIAQARVVELRKENQKLASEMRSAKWLVDVVTRERDTLQAQLDEQDDDGS